MTTTHKIGRWHGAGLLATTLLGTSVFIIPQLTVNIAGEWAVWAWALLTLTILPVALVFAKLSAVYPHSAGPAYFVQQAFGVTLGRSIGVIFLLVVPLGAPAALLMTYQFVETIFYIPDGYSIWVQLSFVLLLFLLNFKGIQVSAALQLALTVIVTAIVLTTFFALGAIEPSSSQTSVAMNKGSLNLMLSAAGLAFWSFLGIEAMSHLSNDFKDPKKDLMPAIMLGTVLVGVIYIICTYLVVQAPSDTPIHMVGSFNQIFGQGGEVVIGSLGIAGGLATVNVYTASLTRLIWSFSNDGVLPRFFQPVNTYGVAQRALITLLTTMSVVLIITHLTDTDLEQLINWVNGVFAIIYFAAMLAAFKLLKPKYRPITALGCVFCILMFWGLGENMAYALVSLVLVMPLLWLQAKRHRLAIES